MTRRGGWQRGAPASCHALLRSTMAHAISPNLLAPRLAQRPKAPRRAQVASAAAHSRKEAAPLPPAPRHAVLAVATAFASASAGAARGAIEMVRARQLTPLAHLPILSRHPRLRRPAPPHASADRCPSQPTQVPLNEPVDLSTMTPLDVITLVAPLLAYGVFYAIREKVSVRGGASSHACALRVDCVCELWRSGVQHLLTLPSLAALRSRARSAVRTRLRRRPLPPPPRLLRRQHRRW